MQQNVELRTDPRTAATDSLLKAATASTLGVAQERINYLRIIRRSIDARQRRVVVNLSVKVWIDEAPASLTPDIEVPHYEAVSAHAPSVVVVGAGPAGLFAALRLIELGLKPILLERGKDVDARRVDMARISRENIVDPDSNYCFGEGGAGAFSDGKLYTRSKKRGSVDKILNILVAHGASEDILVDAHPHIGTDKLPAVIKSIRETIIRCGGEVFFGTRVTDVVIDEAGNVTGVVTADGRRI
ncbi:MAG: FAD-binding protein, partial [Duncaniella sp.]|nr:FAD-binding protein [Duncaniella sp.]